MSPFKIGDEVRDKHSGISGKVVVVMGNKVHLYKVEIGHRGHFWRFETELEAVE